MIVCPKCKGSLIQEKSDHLRCINNNCDIYNQNFPIINGIPILIPFGQKDCILKDSISNNFINLSSRTRDSSAKTMKTKDILRNILLGKNIQTEKNYRYLIDRLKANSKVLFVGGGTIGSGADYFYSKCKCKSIQIDSIDIYSSKNITAIADAHYLPFKHSSYEMVIIQAVLEHVINPNLVVEEIYRVLKNQGIVYAETPFMQCVHEGPYDFTRFSHSGHRWLFQRFKEISSGANHGAFSSTLFVFSYAMSGLFRSKLIGILIRILFSRISKILDTLNDHKSNIDVACGTYFLGTKLDDYNKEDIQIDMEKYYKGAQK